MASSQVEIAPSSPFGRDSRFQNNLVTSCIPNDNIDLTDLWVHHPQWQTTTTPTKCNGSNSNNNDNNYDRSIDFKTQAHNHNDKWARAREIVFPVDRRSAKQSDTSLEVSNLGGVSSLVQKWRGFEAEAKCGSRGNSATTMFPIQDITEPPAPLTNDDDSFGDWESDRTAFSFSGPSPSRGRDSDVTESERLRVADIIRKLTEDRSSDVGSDSPPRVRTSLDQSEQRCLSPVVGSPRIRGRQAYVDLLMQMERDRRKELEGLVGRKAVSKFSHRGRIQALLRIRFLRRGMEAKEGRHPNSTSSESHKAVQSAVTHFRERINPSAQNTLVHSGSCRKELTDNTPAAPSLYAANQIGEEDKYPEVTNSKTCLRVREDHIHDSEHSITTKEHIHHSSLEANENIRENANVLPSYEHLHQEASPLSTFTGQETAKWEISKYSLAKSAETAGAFHTTEINYAEGAKSLHSNEINEQSKEDEATNDHVAETNYDLTGDCANPQSYNGGESTSNQYIAEADTYWVSDTSHPEVGWEQLHTECHRQVGNKDWIDEVSRPRSDWEDLRQARYKEMLDPFLDNEEIRALLGRKSVSTFLSSNMREKIDQLMICRSQGQQTLKNNQTQEEKHEQLPEQRQAVVSEKGEGEDGEDEQDEEGEEYGDYFDEYEEAESSLGQQYNESDEYTDHITSSPPASWPQHQGHESSNCSYQVASPSRQQSSSDYYSQDNGLNSSYRAHPAIEMELIYDLRRHMEQLHQEMSELRKSIKCCTDMQIKLQRSIKKEALTALTHTDRNNGRRDPGEKATSGGRCCVCCKVQVDCLLYRCGHMCTCFKCAHELQWSSGKCPICRAPIVDVVRTYSNQ